MIGVEIIIAMDRSNRLEFMQTFERLTRTEDREDTCLEQGLFEQIGWGNHLLWLERWISQESLDERIASERYTALMGAAEVLGTIEDMRTVEFTAAAKPKKEKQPQA